VNVDDEKAALRKLKFGISAWKRRDLALNNSLQWAYSIAVQYASTLKSNQIDAWKHGLHVTQQTQRMQAADASDTTAKTPRKKGAVCIFALPALRCGWKQRLGWIRLMHCTETVLERSPNTVTLHREQRTRHTIRTMHTATQWN